MRPDHLNADEEEKLPPGLSELRKENPFKVPDNYFDSLADNIQQKINALPDLEKMSKENPFKVPEGYFDSLPTAIQQRIIEGKKERAVYGAWILNLFRPKFLAVAAVVALLVFGIKYLTKPVVLSPSDHYLSYDEIISSSCMNDMDESIILDVLEQDQNKNNGINEDTGIEQYLLDNNIDISQLENHL